MSVDYSFLHKTLKDPTRRDILSYLNKGPLAYMALMNLTKVTNTGRFNYHLKVLGDLIEKMEDGRYRLTERGQLAVQLLEKFPEKPAETVDAISKANVATRKVQPHINIPKKPLIVAVLVLLIGLSAFATVSVAQTAAETLPIEWQQYLPGISGYSAIQTSDGGYLALGENASLLTVSSPAFENYTLIAVKTDSLGNVIWAKNFFNIGISANLIVEVSDGYVLACHKSVKPAEFAIAISQVCLTKIDFQGNIQWTNTYGEDKRRFGDVELDADCYIDSFFQTSDGGYALIGSCSFDYFKDYLWLAKTDAEGNLQWSKTKELATVTPYISASAIFQTSDNGYIIIGTGWDGSVINPDFYEILKINSDGDVQWCKTYGGEGDYYTAFCYSGVATADGGYVMAGSATPEGGRPTGWIVKTDAEGNMVWNKTYSYAGYPSRIQSISQDSDGHLMFIGTAIKETQYGVFDSDTKTFTWITQIDNSGNIQGQLVIDMGNHYDSSVSIIQAADGGHVFVGTWNQLSRVLADQKFWMVKIADFNALPSLIWLLSKLAITSAVIVIAVTMAITTWKHMQKIPLQNNSLPY